VLPALGRTWKAIEEILEMRYAVAPRPGGGAGDVAGPDDLLASVAGARARLPGRLPPRVQASLDRLEGELADLGNPAPAAAASPFTELAPGQRTRHFEVLSLDGDVASVGLRNGSVVSLDKRSSELSVSDPLTGRRQRILGEPIVPGRHLTVQTHGLAFDVETGSAPEGGKSADVLMRQGDDGLVIKGLNRADGNRLALQTAAVRDEKAPASGQGVAGSLNALLNALVGDMAARSGALPLGAATDPTDAARERRIQELLALARDGLSNATTAPPFAHGGISG